MQIKQSSLNKLILICVVLLAVVGVVMLLARGPAEEALEVPYINASGQQVIEMTALNGFHPAWVNARANVESVLKIETKNTFDCSSTLRIPILGVSRVLPASGTTEVAIAAQSPGSQIDGTCSMGMYHFTINFN